MRQHLTHQLWHHLPGLCLLAAVVLGGSHAAGQVTTTSSSDWAPYRSAAAITDLHVPDQPIEPTQFVDCEPCPPSLEGVITDQDLQGMRHPGVYYPQQPTVPLVLGQPTGFANSSTSAAWQWELLPSDVIWHSYWAGVKESRISGTVFEELDGNVSTLDVTLGGRAALARFGTRVNGRPEGFEIQLEGSAMPRLNLDEDWDVDSTDFRFGVPLIYGDGRTQWKLAYYHLSAHLGDEFIERTGIAPTDRINYATDELVLGFSFFPRPAWRLYGEAGWAFYADGGAEPWEFQFGVDYAQPGATGLRGTPFVAVNGYLRQEVNYGGSFTAQAGWLWRGKSGRILRTGVHYLNGESPQLEFSGPLKTFEHHIGAGVWYEF